KNWEDATNLQDIAIADVDTDGTVEIITAGYYQTFMIPGIKSELAIWSVSKVSSSITVTAEPSSIVIGGQVTISGRVTNETGDVPIPNAEVEIEYSHGPLPVLIYLTTVKTNENGEYTFTWTPPAAGNYTIMVSWNGDFEHEGATATTTLFVEKASSLIALTMSNYIAKPGDDITVNGILYPAKAASITIRYTMPNGTVITKTVDSTTAGIFSDTFKANQVGEWTVKASWDGDDQYKEATSTPLTLTVQAEDQTTPLFAMTGLGLGIIALIVALIGVALALRKKTSITPSPPTVTPPPTP
ncbi:MAG: Ig-like domain repeat protein, partial [Candidatus Bathycorpusculaceae bacterium]